MWVEHTQPWHWWAFKGVAHAAGNPAAFRLWLWLQRSLEMSIMCPWSHTLGPGLYNLTWILKFSCNQKHLNSPPLLKEIGIGFKLFCIHLLSFRESWQAANWMKWPTSVVKLSLKKILAFGRLTYKTMPSTIKGMSDMLVNLLICFLAEIVSGF